ncbi:hypothetical protein [Streptomyces violaceusniger]|uniref:hypothetical protein n=1 Tax=Streptomyces violaceusniger TaxID=68280 RepID=UPI0001E4C0FC|nr:hypothetical protein [Streptomyces violaceusniger]
MWSTGRGPPGIEAYYADDVVVQRNEVYRTEQKAGGADSNGIDADKGTTRGPLLSSGRPAATRVGGNGTVA